MNHTPPAVTQPAPPDTTEEHVLAQARRWQVYKDHGMPGTPEHHLHPDAARAIAAWYQSPGEYGIGMARFASTGTISPELHADLDRELKLYDRHDTDAGITLRALAAYIGEVIARTRVRLVIGRTITDRAGDYVPAIDGYRPGAPQDVISIDVPARADTDGPGWAEAVFVATNRPGVPDKGSAAADVHAATIMVNTVRQRSLSVGDTVTVDGVRHVCDRAGWTTC